MPFFGNVGFVKFGTFSVLLALPVMIREGYGQIVYAKSVTNAESVAGLTPSFDLEFDLEGQVAPP